MQERDNEGLNLRQWPKGEKRDRRKRQGGIDQTWQITGYKK